MTKNHISRTSSSNDIPNQNYDVLETLTAQQLLNELIFRVRFLDEIRDEEEEIEFFFSNTPEWQRILEGNVLVTSETLENNNCPCLPRITGVENLSVQSISWYSEYATLCHPNSNNIQRLHLKISALNDEKFISDLCSDCLTD